MTGFQVRLIISRQAMLCTLYYIKSIFILSIKMAFVASFFAIFFLRFQGVQKWNFLLKWVKMYSKSNLTCVFQSKKSFEKN